MAAINASTINACPTTAGYRFEPTGTYRPFATPFDLEMPCGTPAGYPVDMTGYFNPAGKTYSSIFNRPAVPMMSATPFEGPYGVPTRMAPTGTFERPLENWAAWPSTAWAAPSTWNSWWSAPMMAARNAWAPSAFEARREVMPIDLLSCTPFERILYRFLNTVDTTLSTLPRSNEWLCTVNSRPTNSVELYCLTNPIRICDREGNREISLCFDLRGYKAEEINVTLNKAERCIIVEAHHDIKEDKTNHVSRKYSRKFVFPESLAKIDLAKCEISSCFSPEGFVVIECSLPRMTVEEIALIPEAERFFTSPLTRETVCVSTLNGPVNTKPVTVKMC